MTSSNNSTCSIEERYFEDYVPLPFENSRAIKLVHTAPRFGHTNDLMSLFSDVKGVPRNYIVGLVASSIALFCLFLLWTCALVYFKYKGPTNYGWLSGRRIPLPPKPMEGDNVGGNEELTLEEWEQLHHQTQKQHRGMKLLVFMACLFIIISSILMVAYGAQALRNTKTYGQISFYIGIELLSAIGMILKQLAQGLATARQDGLQLLRMVNGICPAVREQICTDILNPFTCNSKGIFVDRSIEALSAFFGGRNQLQAIAEGAYGTVQDIIVFCERIDEQVDEYKIVFVFVGLFVMFLSLVCLYMMLAMIRPMAFRWKEQLHSRLVFPTFLLLICLSFILSTVCIIGSQALADTCIDDPDGRILNITDLQVKQRQQSSFFSSVVYEFVQYYLTQCQAEPFALVRGIVDMDEIARQLSNLELDLEGFEVGKGGVCGPVNTTAMVIAANQAKNYMCGLTNLIQDTRESLRCGTFYPLYANTVHTAMCFSATESFSWIAATQFVIVLMGFVVLTFRVAFRDIEITEGVSDLLLVEEVDEKSEVQMDPQPESAPSIPIDDEAAISESTGAQEVTVPCEQQQSFLTVGEEETQANSELQLRRQLLEDFTCLEPTGAQEVPVPCEEHQDFLQVEEEETQTNPDLQRERQLFEDLANFDHCFDLY